MQEKSKLHGPIKTLSRRAKEKPRPDLKTIFAAELFSKLPEDEQNFIVEQIKALLSHE